MICVSVPTSSVPLPRWLCVASGTSSRMRSTSPSAKPASSSRSAAAPRTSPCAHGHALMPHASTPTTRRTRCGDAAAIPISFAISCVGRPVTGVRRSSGYCASMRTSARSASWRSTMWRAMCSASVSTRNASPITTCVDRLAEELREPRHVHALLGRIEVDGARDLGGERLLAALVADPDRLLDAGDAGAGQAELDLGRRGLQVDGQLVPGARHRVEPYAPMADRALPPPRLARLPRPAHAARDGLRLRAHADAGGGARRAQRAVPRDDRGGVRADDRAARRARRGRADRGGPLGARRSARPTRSSSRRRDDERVVVEGAGETIETEADAVARALEALAVAAVRHGPVEQVTWSVDGPRARARAGHGRARRRSSPARSCAISARSSRARVIEAARRLARARRRDAARPL